MWLLSPIRELLMFESVLMLELPVAFELGLVFAPAIPLVLPVPVALVVLEPLMVDPLFMLLALSDAGATAPPAVAVSVVLALLLLLHAATATTAAKIAMRLMKSSGEVIIRERCAILQRVNALVSSCVAVAISGPRCPGCAKGATSEAAPF